MGNSNSDHDLDEFYEDLQNIVIQQASRIINNDLYNKSLLSSLSVALVSTDKNGLIRVANRAAEEMLQTSLKSIKGSLLIDFLTHSPSIRSIISQAADQLIPVSADSLELVLENGEKKVVNVTVQPLLDEEENLVGSLFAMEDQTYISFLRESYQKQNQATGEGEIVAFSPKMKRLIKQFSEFGRSNEPLLLSGPPGTGKAFLASKIHTHFGPNPQAPIIVFDCHHLEADKASETILGSNEKQDDKRHTLRFKSLNDYGIVHLAEGGTLILRNIEAVGLKGLEALNTYVDKVTEGSSTLPKCRIIGTTEANPSNLDKLHEFSRPLLSKLLNNHIAVPALRDRRKDILPLAKAFLADIGGEDSKTLTKGAENALLSKSYSNKNVHELKEAIELADLVAEEEEIRSEHIFTGPLEEEAGYEYDLTKFSLVRFLIKDKTLAVLRGTFLASFVTLISITLFLPNHILGKIGNHLSWGIGWAFLLLSFLLLGRVWCTVCPLSTAGSIMSRFWSLAKPPPGVLKSTSPFLIPLGFVVIIWAEHTFNMISNPQATAWFLIALVLCAVILAALFEKETWCRYLCPLGNFGGLFSLASTLFVRSNANVCATKCKTHNCVKGSEQHAGCPVFHHPLYARNAHVCKLCFNCLKSCPNDSAKLYLRPPLIRLWKQVDFDETQSYFALVFLFLAPFLLASEQISFFMGAEGFTLAMLASLGLAAVCHYYFPILFFGNHEQKLLHTTRQTLTLVILAWGPFAAFHFGHIPGLDSLFIISSDQGLLQSVLPGGGINLRILVQLVTIWMGFLLATIVLINISIKFKPSGDKLLERSLHFTLGVCLSYSLLSSWIVL